MSNPALVFGSLQNLPQRRRMPVPANIRNLCLCKTCCAAFPERARELRRQQREIRARLNSEMRKGA